MSEANATERTEEQEKIQRLAQATGLDPAVIEAARNTVNPGEAALAVLGTERLEAVGEGPKVPAKTYEPIEPLQDQGYVLEASLPNINGRFVVGDEANPWPYETENPYEQHFLNEHKEIQAVAAEEPSGPVATPAAQEKAEELGVNLAEVEGTGSGGNITVEDVKRAAGPPPEEETIDLRPPEAPPPEEREENDEEGGA